MTYKTYKEENLLPLSALQHLLFCERQCGLIHIEQVWAENLYTAEGRIMHERVDNSKSESRGKVRTEFSIPLRSLRLGLVGKADVVEFHRKGSEWHPFPVEYKRGKPKIGNYDRVQLCAQAMCLEEMLDVEIPYGAMLYGATKRREDVEFHDALRAETEDASRKIHELINSGVTPAPVKGKQCKSCSLVEICMPGVCQVKGKAGRYLQKLINELDSSSPNTSGQVSPE